MAIGWIWLVALAAGISWWVRQDIAVFHRFVALEDTGARQATYWRWIWQSFAILVGASLVSLWLAGGLRPFDTFPAAFEASRSAIVPAHRPQSGDGMLGFAIGVSGGVAAIVFLQWRRLRRALQPVAGTVDALLPRNLREAAIVLVLSINAGFAEELFFRFALPLLLLQLTGSILIAFVLAGIGFGLVHAYQGWKGIVGTMVVGGMLTISYLGNGSLLRVMVIHALINVIALLIRPAIVRWIMASRRMRDSAQTTIAQAAH